MELSCNHVPVDRLLNSDQCVIVNLIPFVFIARSIASIIAALYKKSQMMGFNCVLLPQINYAKRTRANIAFM